MASKKKPEKVRKVQAKAAARFFRKQMGLVGPRVNAKAVVKKIARLFYFSSSQDPDFAREEGFSLLLEDGTYGVYINADLPEGRDSFTYGHETGHIVLRHHEEFDVDNLTDYQHELLDKEANIFAPSI